jgi:hypothetical protein
MRKANLLGGFTATILAIAVAAATPASAQQSYQPGWHWHGPGMMMGPGYMMGPGHMMGPGYMMGPRMMGPGRWSGHWYGPRYRNRPANMNLSIDDVRAFVQRMIAGNPHLKVGSVTEKDANTIVAEVVTTKDGSLAGRYSFDRRTGYYRPVN